MTSRYRRRIGAISTFSGSLLLAALAVTGVPGAAQAAPADTPKKTCTIATPASDHAEAPLSCVSADVELDRAPAVGESSKATVTLTSQVHVDRARLAIRLPEGLRITSDGFSAPAPRGLDTTADRTLSLDPGKQTVTFTVTADKAGPAQVQADLSDVAAPAVERTAHASAEVTVGRTSQASHDGVTGTVSPAHRIDGSVAPDLRANTTNATTPKTQICATGKLTYADYYGKWLPGRRATVKVMAQATAGAEATAVATGLTDATKGTYSLCFKPKGQTVAAMWVELSTDNGWWQVTEMTGKTPYTVAAPQRTDVPVGSTQGFGTTSPDALHMKAFHAFDVINKIYDIRGSGTQCWTQEENADCSRFKARWAPGNTDGGYYNTDPAIRSVFLTDAMPDAPTSVVHEAGHNFQHLLYNWAWANGDCPSPHYLHRVTGPSCAWTEGFPNAIVAYVFPDGRYYYNVDTWMDLRQTGFQDTTLEPARTNPDNGDSCECRIAGAMYGLWTKVDGGPQRTFRSMDEQFSDTFSEWFNTDRKKAGLPVGAKARAELYKYTIDYRIKKQKESVRNGSLEDQGKGWTYDNEIVGTYPTYQPHTGRYYAWMGGNGTPGNDTLAQKVTIPKGGTTLLDFQLRLTSTELTTVKADNLKLQVVQGGKVTTVYTWWNGDDTSQAYAHRVIDLTRFAGTKVTLRFVSTEDQGEQTDFVLDDISLKTG